MQATPQLAPLTPRVSVVAPRVNHLLHLLAAVVLMANIWISESSLVPLYALLLLAANWFRTARRFRVYGRENVMRLGQDAAGWWIQRADDTDVLPARPESVVVTGLYLRVCWRLDNGDRVRMWLWRDALIDADYRALARQLRQTTRGEPAQVL